MTKQIRKDKKQTNKNKPPVTGRDPIFPTLIWVDGTSYRIPQRLLDTPDEQLIALYRGWRR